MTRPRAQQWQPQIVEWQPGWAFAFTVGGETVGPCRSDAFCVHLAARESIAKAGGTAVVLRAVEGRWRCVATYTAGVAGAGQ